MIRIGCLWLLLGLMQFGRSHPSEEKILAGYYRSFASSSLPPSSIRYKYYTHIFYAFVQPIPGTHALNITQSDAALLESLAEAAHRRNVRVILSIGGGGSNSSEFADMASRPSSRAAFIRSSIAAAREFGLDGLDLDWEFPATEHEMRDLGALFWEWRAAIDAEAAALGKPALLLTAAVYYSPRISMGNDTRRSYPVEALAESVDWVGVMCFDLHGAGWEPTKTGAHAALRDRGGGELSGSFGVGAWLGEGMPGEKLVLGMPLYGRTWKLRRGEENGIGAPADGPGPGDEGGVLSYANITIEFGTGADNGAVTTLYDELTVAAYSFKGNAWVGYDDLISVSVKVKFARMLGLRGSFYWALGLDDANWSMSRQAWYTWREKTV